MASRHPTTIKDIARVLGISVATVSRALRDSYDVSHETREKVLTTARELNYRPNLNAIGLVNNKSYSIGIILPLITNYYFSTVISGIQEIAWSNGYNVILYVTNDSPERELSILENIAYSRLDGLLACISSDSDCDRYYQNIIDEGIPIVFFDRIAINIKTSKVVQDDYNGAFEAVEHLISCGYRKIAHLSGPKGFALTENRTNGYMDALKKHNLAARSEWLINSGFSQESGEQDMLQLLESEERPDAVFGVNDRKAVGALIALKSKGIKIGKEIGVVGFTNDPLSSIISPALTTVAEPAFEIGIQSCKLLMQHIAKQSFEPREVVLRGELVVRESTAR